MKNALRPIVLTGVIFAVLTVALLAVLLVLDVGNREEIQEALIKALLIIAILLAASFAIWGIVKLSRKE